MTDLATTEQLERDFRRKRLRDYALLTSGVLALLVILFVTGSLGWIELIIASLVIISGALALYVGVSQPGKLMLNSDETSTVNDTAYKEKLFGKFVVALPFPAFLISAEARIAIANEKAINAFQLDDPAGEFLDSVLQNRGLIRAVKRTRKTGTGEIVEFTLGGALETWLAHISPGPSEGTAFILMEDLTAVRRAEEARADFFANASHELRTPLTAIAGFIETMQGAAKDDKSAWDGFLTIMHSQAERMKRLIADLLSLSRIEFSEHSPPSTLIDIKERTYRAALGLAPIAKEANVELNFKLAPVAAMVVAEADEMTQVVQNLIGNALKYSPTGNTVTISLDIADSMSLAQQALINRNQESRSAVLLHPRASTEVPAVWIRITDHGRGVPPEHIARLGERFYRVDQSRGGKIEGTGLGLAIVKHIMTRHRGGLAVESLTGVETSFGVWLPLSIPDPV
ncbi:MAG: ATP-binding protein [Pseudomonadota bacterium]